MSSAELDDLVAMSKLAQLQAQKAPQRNQVTTRRRSLDGGVAGRRYSAAREAAARERQAAGRRRGSMRRDSIGGPAGPRASIRRGSLAGVVSASKFVAKFREEHSKAMN
eukprot:2245624-Prymnesium_polylepis.1